MTQFCSAQGCAHPTTGSLLCPDHRKALTKVTRDLPGLLVHLQESTLRQVRYSQIGGMALPNPDESPVPFNTHAANLERKAAATIRLWQGRAADRLGIPARHPIPLRAASWIRDSVIAGRLDAWVDLGKMLDDLEKLAAKIMIAIDRPDTSWYAGQCGAPIPTKTGQTVDCTNELYVPEGSPIVECRQCGATFQTSQRRDILLAEVDKSLATATEIARALTVLTDELGGETNLVRRIGAWKDRGRIEQVGTIIEHGIRRPTYRVGDVRALLALEAQRVALRREAKSKKDTKRNKTS